MKKEIGSEFWSVPCKPEQNGIFPKETNWFLSGRFALQAIINDCTFKSVSFPDWCCDSMIIPFLRSGISVCFYDALNPPCDFLTDAVLVMDYFGYTSTHRYSDFNGVVIRDITHSLLSKHYDDSDYYFGSLRKWAGFYTGGYAWGFKKPVKYDSMESEYISLRKDAMLQKESFICGYSESKEYLHIFAEAEDKLDEKGIINAYEQDIYNAFKLDVTFIKEARRRNARILLDAFSDVAIFPEIGPNDCPMFVPIRVKNRDGLRKWLIQNEIYCPVHWTISEYHKLSENTRRLYNEEISLVCDQRYDENDMLRIIEAVKSYDGR